MKNIQASVNQPIKLFSNIRRVIIITLALFIISQVVNHSYVVKADANSKVNVRLDFLEEIAVVSAGPDSSTKFYISADNMKSWEVIDNSGVVDLSTIMSSKAVFIYFKGNKDLNPVKIELPAEDKGLIVKYEITGGEGRIVISSSTFPVEYRKGNNGAWKTASNNMTTSIYELKGATLYFRTVATASRRAGKIVTVKIPKRPTAPSVSLDASKLCIKGLKSDQTQYRVGDALNWSDFAPQDNKTNTMDLSTLLAGTSSTNSAIPAGIIEFRTTGSERKLHSAVKIIEILPQSAAPNNVTLSGTTLTISDPDVKRYYEYTVVSKNLPIDINKVKWTSITAKKPVVIRKAAVGDKILIRLKSTKLPETKQITLPSIYKELTVTEITNTK